MGADVSGEHIVSQLSGWSASWLPRRVLRFAMVNRSQQGNHWADPDLISGKP